MISNSRIKSKLEFVQLEENLEFSVMMNELKLEKPVMVLNQIVGVRHGSLNMVLRILFCMTSSLFR